MTFKRNSRRLWVLSWRCCNKLLKLETPSLSFSRTLWVIGFFVGAHPVGDGGFISLWELACKRWPALAPHEKSPTGVGSYKHAPVGDFPIPKPRYFG